MKINSPDVLVAETQNPIVSDAPDEASAPTARRRWRIRPAWAVACLVIAVLTVGTALLGKTWLDDRAVEQVREEVPGIASTQLVAMLGYDFNTVDTELPRAYDGLTGSFRDDYQKLVTEAIIPGAKEKQLVVKVTVQADGVVSASRERAVVLLFVNQVTTGRETPEAVTTGSRVRVTLDKVDETWLMSGLTPI